MFLIVGVMALFLTLLYFFQERLLFFPQRITAERTRQMSGLTNVETIEFRSPDGVAVRGWLLKNPAARPYKLLLYYGGNAEEVSYLAEGRNIFVDRSPVLVNYRGYGGSDGSPGERELLQDALEVYDAMVKRPDVDAGNIILMGRSLGTGIAVHVAANRPSAGLILVSPYDSMVNVAKRHYPYLPVGQMLKHRFDSAALAPDIKCPTLILAASADTIVPREHSAALANRLGGKVVYREIGNADHNTIGLFPAFSDSIQEFIKGIL
jgi:pimeloyl-ACP methyl ester carboxylesterase